MLSQANNVSLLIISQDFDLGLLILFILCFENMFGKLTDHLRFCFKQTTWPILVVNNPLKAFRLLLL